MWATLMTLLPLLPMNLHLSGGLGWAFCAGVQGSRIERFDPRKGLQVQGICTWGAQGPRWPHLAKLMW